MIKILIRDEKTVFNEVENPTILYDKRDYVRHTVGEKENIYKIYNEWRKRYMDAGLQDMADDLAVLELPANQALMDELFQCDGKFKAFIQKYIELEASEGVNKNEATLSLMRDTSLRPSI
jgi:hypothetical protein